MVLGVLLLNEHMTVGFIAGAVLIVFGVLYSNARQREKQMSRLGYARCCRLS